MTETCIRLGWKELISGNDISLVGKFRGGKELKSGNDISLVGNIRGCSNQSFHASATSLSPYITLITSQLQLETMAWTGMKFPRDKVSY